MSRRTTTRFLAIALLLGAVIGGALWHQQDTTGEVDLVAGTWSPQGSPARGDRIARSVPPLTGRTVVIDPGHQLGNHNYPRRINHEVPAGGFKKPCNTTGTATRGGFSESTFAWRVAREVGSRLVEQGAQVVFTRHSNREDRWGPCVDERGRAGNASDADLKISIHGDGSNTAGAHGFHVIAPTDRSRWTHDIYRTSRRLAVDTRAALRAEGVPVANYTAGGDGLDFRSDLGTLNLSDIPTVMVELGNMRNPGDAHRMTTASGRATYARGLAAAVRNYLG